MVGDARPAVMNVVNYGLPVGDYRVHYAEQRAARLRVIFALPSPPASVREEDFVPMPFGEGLEWRDVFTFARLARVLRRMRPTLAFVHFYSTKLVLLGPMIAAAAGVPSVVTVTGFGRLFNDDRPFYGVARVVYRLVLAAATRFARLVLFQNRGDMETTVSMVPSCASKARYVGSATSEVPGVQRTRGGGVLRVLHVARLLPSKGITDFVAVARELRDEPIEFVLVGGASHDYPETAAVVADAMDCGVVSYRGRLAGAELDSVYRESDVLFFPSYGEGMARVMLEAGMYGLCPVAYDIAANRDLIGNGEGFLVPLRDTAAAARTLRLLAGDREAVAKAAEAYRSRIRDEFGMDVFAARMDQVVRELIPVMPGPTR